MAMSGIGVNEDCVTEFNDQKMRNKYKYIIYDVTKNKEGKDEIDIKEKLECQDGKKKDVDESEERAQWEDFLTKLPDDEPRYCSYDFNYIEKERATVQNKLLFVYWCPDSAPIKKKMVSASTKDALTKKLQFNDKKFIIQANEKPDLDYDTIKKDLK